MGASEASPPAEPSGTADPWADGVLVVPENATLWINDTAVQLDQILVEPNATLVLQRSAVSLGGPGSSGYVRVAPGGALRLGSSSLVAASPSTLWVDGQVEARGADLAGLVVVAAGPLSLEDAIVRSVPEAPATLFVDGPFAARRVDLVDVDVQSSGPFALDGATVRHLGPLGPQMILSGQTEIVRSALDDVRAELRGTAWLNDSVVRTLSWESWLIVHRGASLLARNATLHGAPAVGGFASLEGSVVRDADGAVYVGEAGTLEATRTTFEVSSFYLPGRARLEDAEVLSPSRTGSSSVYSIGSLDVTRTVFDRVSVQAFASGPGETARVRASTFRASDLALEGDAVAEGNLIYNASLGLALGAGAKAFGNTVVNCPSGIRIEGEGVVVEGNEVRFNVVGIRWDGVSTATVRGNNLRDNYQDGVFGNGQGGVTLDVSGNWWDGTPGADGDSYGGAGVGSSSHALARFPVAERTAELPFALHSVRGDATWTGPSRLDGPVIARGGTLTVRDLDLDANGFLLGSHVGARLRVEQATVRNMTMIFARADDSFDGLTAIPAPGGGGIAAISSSVVVRNSRFVGGSVGVVASPRQLAEAPPSVLVESSTFEGTSFALAGGLMQPTLRGATVRGGIGTFTVLCPSIVIEDGLFVGGSGVISALDQGLTVSRSSVYDGAYGVVALVTPATLRDVEIRFTSIGVLSGGSQTSLVGSNVYDNPGFGLYAATIMAPDPVTGEPRETVGIVTVDATSYSSDPTRGDVRFLPPRRASPGPTPGRTGGPQPILVDAGETLSVASDRTLAAPLIVRAGGTLRVEGAALDAGRHLVGVMPGGAFVARNATLRGAIGIHVHADAVVEDSVVTASGAGLVILESAAARVRGSRFLGSGGGLTLWDAKADVERSLFASATLTLTNETWPRRGEATIRQSVFSGTSLAIRAVGNPVATVRDVSFDTWFAIDASSGSAFSPADGAGIVDARGSWFGHPLGPRAYGVWQERSGAYVRQPDGAQTVLYEPWRDNPFRASFEPSTRAPTDLDAVVFRNTSFDLDGRIRAQRWDFGDGSPVSTEREPTHVFARHGPVTVRLEVVDDAGVVSVAEEGFVVRAVPRASLSGPTEVLSLVESVFDASASSDPDGRVAAWRFETSDGRDTGFAASPTLRHAFVRPGDHWVRVTARDADGLAGAPETLAVRVANRAPSALMDVSHAVATRIQDVAFVSRSKDADGAIAATTWDFGDGSAPVQGATARHRYASLGSFQARLRVVDDLGAANETTRVVEVVNVPPVAAFSYAPLRVQPGREIAFASGASDPDGAAPAHAWDFGDGTPVSGERDPKHVFPQECDCVVRLTVTDADGATAVAERTLVVRLNRPPEPAFEPVPGATDDAWTFSDASLDPDGTIVSWRWDFGDGRSSAERSPTHRYREAGPMRVRLTVVDDAGDAATLERTILVDDTLAAAAQVLPAPPRVDEAVYAHVRAAWLNGTGERARYELRFERLDATGAWVAHASYEGDTRDDGVVTIRMPFLAPGANLPGSYRVVGEASTGRGLGGGVERAAFETRFEIAPVR